MFPPKRLGRFFALVVLVYAALMAPWPGLEPGYAHLFRGGANVLFARFWFWADGSVRFLDLHQLKPGDLAPGTPAMAAYGTFDTVMELRSRRAPASIGYLRTSSRYVGYGPMVLVAALIAATPMVWRKKAWSLSWGMLAVHAFIALRLTLTLTATGFAADKPYALFHPGPFWRGAITRVETILSDDPTVSFVIPAIIWFIVAARKGDWSGRVPKDRSPSGSGETAIKASS